jgi:hypothetical protein
MTVTEILVAFKNLNLTVLKVETGDGEIDIIIKYPGCGIAITGEYVYYNQRDVLEIIKYGDYYRSLSA